MLRSAKEIEGYAVSATDGDIGHVKDLYLDDEKWVIRYLVVDTGGWLSSRQVLVSPISVGTPNWEQKLLPVLISKDQVSKSPDIATDKPVSRQHEMAYSGYYDYPYYWIGSGYWGGGMVPNQMMPGRGGIGRSDAGLDEGQRESSGHENDDPHLRSCNAVVGYHIHASDGDIGHVAGMLIDEETWAVRYLVVDTSNWWLGHQVLIAPQWIEAVNWFDKTVTVSVTRQAVKDAPAYDAHAAMSREDEDRLYQHYGRSDFWSGYPVREDE
ncbi:MAG: PRC-barrel domain containing protein [Oxalobacteraceae bacterium]|nr:PRC-barrel domain containing protein [Oxalobacteraceae bacterium]